MPWYLALPAFLAILYAALAYFASRSVYFPSRYSIEWSKWLAGDQIQTSTRSVSDPAIEASNSSNAASRATASLSGGTAGQSYTVTNRITSSGARTDERSFIIQLQDR